MSFFKDDRLKKGRSAVESDSDKKSGIFLTARQTSLAVSSLLLTCFFVFISGYFLGKKKAVEKFYSKVKQDSFADHIYYSMCSMYDKADELQEEAPVSTQSNVVALPEQDIKPQEQPGDLVAQAAAAIEQEIQKETAVTEQKIQAAQKSNEKYYAELIGFGTNRAAEKFANKLKKDNISVTVKRRRSKTAKGRVITWYQVVTEKFSNRNDLIALVDDISAQERLKDVRIVSC